MRQHGSWYADIAARLGFTPVNKAGDAMLGPLTLSGAPTVNLHAATKLYVDNLVTAAAMLTKLLTVDGAGSGLDADLLDGLNSTDYVQLTGAQSITGQKTMISPIFTTPTIDNATVPTIAGAAPLYMARAKLNFNGTGTIAIRDSGNIASISDGGTGVYTINLSTAMPDTNGVIVPGTRGSGTNNNHVQQCSWLSTSSIRMTCYSGLNGVGSVDFDQIYLAVL